MPSITEKNLEFNFPPGWLVVKYDQDAEPVTDEPAGFYRRVILPDGVQQVRGMDIVCRLPGQQEALQFIEVKDERERNSMVDAPLRHEELRQTMLRKTLRTLASLVLAERLGDDSLRPMACLSRQPQLEVVLFLEEPPVPIPRRTQLRRGTEKDRVNMLDQRLTSKFRQ
jgi:hypothetical protein